ncbi:hypothetical protein CLV56_2442 [Mumia flava]|uniref:Uncharacterized protein n=1 Tax=Mumia flava TaxID=1348852 RepID=A0A0B2BVF0_9ACTN|nr:hypothetical protein [Mumia flava]PJJ58196.1 hypothetical protein CLV56_2442 [Mumia flava]
MNQPTTTSLPRRPAGGHFARFASACVVLLVTYGIYAVIGPAGPLATVVTVLALLGAGGLVLGLADESTATDGTHYAAWAAVAVLACWLGTAARYSPGAEGIDISVLDDAVYLTPLLALPFYAGIALGIAMGRSMRHL